MTAQPALLPISARSGPSAPAEAQAAVDPLEAYVRAFLPPRPYTGLRPFQKDEWPIFCGRDRIVQEIIDILGASHLAFVIGASGSGKSSLVRAGVLATVEGRHSMVGIRWRTAAMRPGAQPFLALAEAVLEAEIQPNGDRAAAGTLEDAVALSLELENTPHGLAAIVKRLGICDNENENLLLLVDQFEELFRYQAGTNEDERRHFIEQLVRVARERPPGLYVAITMRAEFLGECTRYRGLADVVNRTHYLVPPMNRAELQEAITRPARLKGGEVEGSLARRLLADVAEREDHLPILQHSLAQMWTEAETSAGGVERPRPPVLTLARYVELKGDADSLMARHCEDIYSRLAPELCKVAQTMFRRMVEVEERRTGLRRPTRSGTVADLAGVGLDGIKEVAGEFAAEGASFIQIGRRPITGETSLDITHESLIRQWPRLEDWLRAERRSYETLKDLTRAARLRAEGRAGLWSGQELAGALAWREEERPTQLWARRYGGDFAAAMRFLLDSEEAERRTLEARQRAEEHATRRKQEQEAHEHERRLARERQHARQAEIERDLQRQHAERAEIERDLQIARAQAAEAERKVAFAREKAALQDAARAQLIFQRTFVGLLASFALIIALLMTGYSLYFQKKKLIQAQLDAIQAQVEATQAQGAAETARDIATRVWTLTGRAQLAADGATGSVLIARAFLDLRFDVPEVEGLAYAGLQRLRERRELPIQGTQVGSVWFTPDGAVMAATANGQIEAWDGRDFSALPPYKMPSALGMLRARSSADGERVLVGSFRGGGAVLRRVDGKLEPEWPTTGAPGTIAFDERLGSGALSGDGRLAVVVGGRTPSPALWNVVERRQLWPGSGGEGEARQGRNSLAGPGFGAVAISKDGARFAVTQEGKVQIRMTGAPYQELSSREMGTACGDTPSLTSLAFNPQDPEMLLGTGVDGCVLVWRKGEARPVHLPGHRAIVFEGTFSPDGKWIATAGEDRAVRLWKVADVSSRGHEAESFEVRGHTSTVFSVAFSRDGQSFASGSSDRTVRIWNIEPLLPERAEPGSKPTGQDAAVELEEGKPGESLTLRIKEPDGFKVELKVPYDFGKPALAAVSRDRSYALVAPREDGRPLLYRIATPQAPVAELGEQRRRWGSLFFEGGEPGKPAATSGDTTHYWTFFPDRSELRRFATEHLPFRGKQPVELSPDRQCLLGLKKGKDCATLPRDNSN